MVIPKNHPLQMARRRYLRSGPVIFGGFLVLKRHKSTEKYFPVPGVRVGLVAEQARLSLLVPLLVFIGGGRPTAGTL